MTGGWLKMHRKALENPELREPDAFRFWFWLLANASYEARTVYRGKGGRPIELEPGQLVVSTANGLDGLSRKRVRTLLSRFSNCGMITQRTARDTGHTITIVKWLEYQDKDEAGAIQGPSKGTYKGHTRAIQGPTAKEGKEGKEDSVAKATGANGADHSPEADIKRTVYEHGKRVLGTKAGGAITKAIAKCGLGATAEMIEATEREHALEPMAFFQKCVQRRSQPGGIPYDPFAL